MHAAGEREIADSIDVDGPVIDGEVTRIADPLSTHARAARVWPRPTEARGVGVAV